MGPIEQAWLAGEKSLERKKPAEAEQHFLRALALASTHVPAWVGLSTALTQQGRHREAHEAAMRAWRGRSRIPPVLFAVAQRLRYFHEFAALVDTLTTAEFVFGAPSDVLAKAAVMLSSIGAHEDAAMLVEQGLLRNPRDATCLYVRGNFHTFQGDNDAAEACYEASLRLDPLLFQNSMMLAGARRAVPGRNHVERFRQQLGRARPGGTGEVYLSFALHRQLHDLGRDDEAWGALERGCRAKRRQVEYSLTSDQALLDRILAVCTREFVRASGTVIQPAVPIFIVGMHRSGTTLLERILAGHPLVGDAGETSAFHAEMELALDRAAPQGPDAAFVAAAGSVDFAAVSRGYAHRAQWLARGRPFFTEKLPQNFLNVGFIAKAIPQARFLHLVRDPMDTCFSNLRQLFSGAALYSYDQHELAGFYLLYRRAMAHWRDVLPGRILDVPYGRLVTEPEAMAREVARHCGLEFDPAMVHIERASGTVSTPSATAVHQGFQTNRGEVWRRYGKYLEPLRVGLEPAYAEPVPA